MAFYIITWAVFYLLSLFFLLTRRRAKKVKVNGAAKRKRRWKIRVDDALAILALAVLAFFVACRNNVGADWGGYVSFYNTGEMADGRDILQMEPLFRLIRTVLYGMGFSYQVFFFVLSFLSLYALYRVSRSFGAKNGFIVLIVYISLYLYSFQLNLVRTGIMCSCVWIAMSYRKDSLWKALIWMLVGAGFHYLGLLCIPFLFIADKPLSRKGFIILIVLSVLALLSNIVGRIVDSVPVLSSIERVGDYLSSESFRTGHGLSIGLLFNMAFCIYMRFRFDVMYEKDTRMCIMINMLLFAIVLTGCLNGLGIIAQRFGQCLTVAIGFMWSFFLTSIRKVKPLLLWTALFTVYLLLFYSKTFDPLYIADRPVLPYLVDSFHLFR